MTSAEQHPEKRPGGMAPWRQWAYKDIVRVMAAQQDLVEIIARFDPALVKMAPSGERPED